MYSYRRSLVLVVGSFAWGLAWPEAARAQATVEREALVEQALGGHPTTRAAEERARSREQEGESESSLPAPELMAELWEVPLSRPLALDEAGMLMFGLRQAFPAPGSLAARERAAQARAESERRAGQASAQIVAREVRHAFADYRAAVLRERAHAAHGALAAKLVSSARDRLASGAALSELTRATLELERIEADRAEDAVRVESARAELNVLLGRAPERSVPAPEPGRAETAAPPLSALLAQARKRRPELAALRARSRAAEAEEESARSEATWPSFSIAALYFAPVGGMESGIGASASVSLPWLWGGARSRSEATRRDAAATAFEAEEAARSVTTDVARSHARLRALEARAKALDAKLLPAARRHVDVSLAAYGSGAGSLAQVLEARAALAEAELAWIEVQAELEHALADLEWAVGGGLARRPVTQVSGEREVPHGK